MNDEMEMTIYDTVTTYEVTRYLKIILNCVGTECLEARSAYGKIESYGDPHLAEVIDESQAVVTDCERWSSEVLDVLERAESAGPMSEDDCLALVSRVMADMNRFNSKLDDAATYVRTRLDQIFDEKVLEWPSAFDSLEDTDTDTDDGTGGLDRSNSGDETESGSWPESRSRAGNLDETESESWSRAGNLDETESGSWPEARSRAGNLDETESGSWPESRSRAGNLDETESGSWPESWSRAGNLDETESGSRSKAGSLDETGNMPADELDLEASLDARSVPAVEPAREIRDFPLSSSAAGTSGEDVPAHAGPSAEGGADAGWYSAGQAVGGRDGERPACVDCSPESDAWQSPVGISAMPDGWCDRETSESFNELVRLLEGKARAGRLARASGEEGGAGASVCGKGVSP
ncbi:MAG: hypothetical protein LBT40_11320 [Deltaproteobacteria bacterium]|jgi:hypothetical protein|nr:hypothetical protein [Deltaproteobacteria bacterium]